MANRKKIAEWVLDRIKQGTHEEVGSCDLRIFGEQIEVTITKDVKCDYYVTFENNYAWVAETYNSTTTIDEVLSTINDFLYLSEK